MNTSETTDNAISSTSTDLIYVGFWRRLGATMIDSLIVLCVTLPLLLLYYGESYLTSEAFVKGTFDFFVSWVFPIVATIWFWIAKQATPGKIVIHAKIVDAQTGMAPTSGQYIGRYFAYFLSLLPFGLGYIWIALHP